MLAAGLRDSRSAEKGAMALYDALTVLWWGYTFSFYRGDRIVLQKDTSLRLGRHITVKDPQGPPRPPTSLFFSVQRGDDGFPSLVIDLRIVPGAHGKEIADAVGVDVAAISVRLFELDDQEEIDEFSEQLAERILLAVRTV